MSTSILLGQKLVQDLQILLRAVMLMGVMSSLTLVLCFPCVLQIGGPRGEKGQKGEPAIIEPVRSKWCFGVSVFPREKSKGYV